LVVAYILPSHGFAVLNIVHQRAQLMRGYGGSGENHQLGVVLIAPNNFFAPVAHDVGT
jgi:hypothetical protein